MGNQWNPVGARRSIWLNLFPTQDGNRFGGRNDPVQLRRTGHHTFSVSAWPGQSDVEEEALPQVTETLGKGSCAYPDVIGELVGKVPLAVLKAEQARLSAWWRPIQRGPRAGRMYLRVCLTALGRGDGNEN